MTLYSIRINRSLRWAVPLLPLFVTHCGDGARLAGTPTGSDYAQYTVSGHVLVAASPTLPSWIAPGSPVNRATVGLWSDSTLVFATGTAADGSFRVMGGPGITGVIGSKDGFNAETLAVSLATNLTRDLVLQPESGVIDSLSARDIDLYNQTPEGGSSY